MSGHHLGRVKGPFTNIWGKPEIGEGTEIGAYVEIGDKVTIGKDCSIQSGAFIPPGVIIGDRVFIGPRVVFTNDKYPRAKQKFEILNTEVGSDTSIGANATILPGIKIGERVLIGAGAVVKANVPDGEVWVGNPAAKKEKDVLEEIMWVEERAWPKELQASRMKMGVRLEVFPEGVATISDQGQMVAVSTSLVFKFDPDRVPRTWEGVTHSGWIIGTHSLVGNALYIVSVGVAQDYQGKGYGDRLLAKQKETAKRLNLAYVVLGSRVPSAHLHPDKAIEEIVEEDKQIAFYRKNGFEVVRIVPNYMYHDPESRNFGVVMVHTL